MSASSQAVGVARNVETLPGAGIKCTLDVVPSATDQPGTKARDEVDGAADEVDGGEHITLDEDGGEHITRDEADGEHTGEEDGGQHTGEDVDRGASEVDMAQVDLLSVGCTQQVADVYAKLPSARSVDILIGGHMLLSSNNILNPISFY